MKISLELGVGLHERQQLLATELDHLAGDRRARPKSVRRPESMLTSPVNSPGPWTVMSVSPRRWPDDLDLTCGHHEERHDVVAGLDQHLSALDLAHAPVRGDARDLRGRQRRKHVLGT